MITRCGGVMTTRLPQAPGRRALRTDTGSLRHLLKAILRCLLWAGNQVRRHPRHSCLLFVASLRLEGNCSSPPSGMRRPRPNPTGTSQGTRPSEEHPMERLGGQGIHLCGIA